ncbi:MAG: hypothetical protein K2J00_07175, partial [Bacteroidaceae bacterium]|nr:hypothetical protein [Bacteroidaceae bacterium]
MRKFTSFFVMMVLCCISAFAQETETVGTELPKSTFVKIGTAQAEMVPGKWYFVHSTRNSGEQAKLENFVLPGEPIAHPACGGLATDDGLGKTMLMSTHAAINELTNEEGVNIDNYLKYVVRFVAVPDVDGAYNIQFGTGNWMASDAPKTVNNNTWLAGEAGQYNFYLIPMASEDNRPNTAGRFAWNKHDMANRVDNNGTGNTISFWSTGHVTSANVSDAGEIFADEEISGNKVWQIYDIEIVGTMGQQVLYQEAFDKLVNLYAEINNLNDGNFIQNLQDGVNVGTSYGNYRQEDVDAFLEFNNLIGELLNDAEINGIEVVMDKYPTLEDIQKLYEDYEAVYNNLNENRIPIAMSGIASGYYTIINAANDFWYVTVKDTTFYTEEEAEAYNNELGLTPEDEDYKTVKSIKEITSRNDYNIPVKALCSQDSGDSGWLAWTTLEEKPNYLWKIEGVEGKPLEYRLINMLRGTTFKNIGQSGNAPLVKDDTYTVCFDYRDHRKVFNGKDSIEADVFNIRSSSQAANSYFYLHCGGHSSGAGKGSWIVGWADGGATQWFLQPIDEATANEWLNGPAAQLRAMIHKADSIANAGPGQITVAEDIVTTIFEEDSVVVTVDQFYSQYTEANEGSLEALLDGNQSTFWHSAWSSGNVDNKVHYLQINANETLEGMYAAKITRRPVSGDHITKLAVKGYEEEPSDSYTFEDGKDLGTLDLPIGSNDETIISAVFDATGCNYLRFYCLETKAYSNGGGAGRGYWHASEFNVFKAEQNKRYETTQYDVRKAQADALTAAIENW